MDNAAANLAYAIASILLVVDPQIILLGGGMAGRDDWLINPIRKAVPEIAHFDAHRRVPIRRADLWDEAVLYGAISLFSD
jgi:glucokinase